MAKELFALYLVFSTPNGVEEKFIMGRENCDNLQPIVEQEFKRLNINRDELKQSGTHVYWLGCSSYTTKE